MVVDVFLFDIEKKGSQILSNVSYSGMQDKKENNLFILNSDIGWKLMLCWNCHYFHHTNLRGFNIFILISDIGWKLLMLCRNRRDFQHTHSSGFNTS
jgi:hypothetical protein